MTLSSPPSSPQHNNHNHNSNNTNINITNHGSSNSSNNATITNTINKGEWAIVGLMVMYLLLKHDAPAPSYLNIIIVYRGMWLMVLYVFLSGLNVVVWERYNINYLSIFGLDSTFGSCFLEFFEAAASLAFLWSIGAYSFGLGASPIAICFIFWVVVLSPINIFYKHTRQWIGRHVRGFFLGPYALVNFASCWVADQFTSATVALVDFEYTVCHYFFLPNFNCDASHKYLQPIFVGFPFVWRLIQCLKQYSDTHQRSHLLNAGKYSASLVAIFFSTLHLITQDDPNKWSVYRSYWVVAIVISTLYSYTWDLTMDWGFLKRNPHTKKFMLLREVLIYEKPIIYYFVMISNLMMRTTWLITLNPDYFGIHFRRDILVFFLASVELIRRVQWNFFRMELEHINRFHTSRPTKHIVEDEESSFHHNKLLHRHHDQQQEKKEEEGEEERLLGELN